MPAITGLVLYYFGYTTEDGFSGLALVLGWIYIAVALISAWQLYVKD